MELKTIAYIRNAYKEKFGIPRQSGMTDIASEFAGRLMVGFHRYPGLRGRSFKLETFFKDMTVHEILDKPYEIKLIYG